MTDEQYGIARAYQHEQATRQLMALLMAAFPHLARDIDNIGRGWDSRLDAFDSHRAWENAAKLSESSPVGADKE